MPCTSRPYATLSITRRCGKSPKCWNTIATFVRRRSRSSFGCAPRTSWPHRSIAPDVGSIRRVMQRTSVDFPLPERPMTTKTSPRRTSNVISRDATVQPVLAISSARGRSTSPFAIAFAAFGPKTFHTLRQETWTSEEANCPPLVVDVDAHGSGRLAVAGHRLHVAAQRDEPARARVRADVAHGDREAGRRVRERRVVREGEVRLRHADRELVEADALELLDLLARGRLQEDPVAAVHPRHYRLDLPLDRVVQRIDGGEVGRLLRGRDDRLRELGRALAATYDRLVRLGRERAVRDRDPPDLLDLLVGVGREAVDRDDRVQPELADRRQVADHVRRAGLDRLRSSVGVAAVVFQRLHRRDEDDR